MSERPWQEPVRGRWAYPALTRLTGIEQSRAFIDGSLPAPPVARLTGLHPTDAGLTHSTFALPVTGWLLNPYGALVPSTAALVSDAPLGSVFSHTLPLGKACTTSELSISYLRPADLSAERLIAQADVIKAGRSTGLTQAHIFDGEGRLLAHATSRMVVLDVPVLHDAPMPEPEEHADDDPWRREPTGAVLPHDVLSRLPGRELLEGWISGELASPPIHHLTGLRPAAIEGDEVVWTMPAHEWLCSPGPYLYGGALALLADAALTAGVLPDLPGGVGVHPLDLKLRFIRPVMPGSGLITARARAVHRGKALAVIQGVLTTSDGREAVLAEASVLLRPTGS